MLPVKEWLINFTILASTKRRKKPHVLRQGQKKFIPKWPQFVGGAIGVLEISKEEKTNEMTFFHNVFDFEKTIIHGNCPLNTVYFTYIL